TAETPPTTTKDDGGTVETTRQGHRGLEAAVTRPASYNYNSNIVDSRRRFLTPILLIPDLNTLNTPSAPPFLLHPRFRRVNVVFALPFFRSAFPHFVLVILGSDPHRFVILDDDATPGTSHCAGSTIPNPHSRHLRLVHASFSPGLTAFSPPSPCSTPLYVFGIFAKSLSSLPTPIRFSPALPCLLVSALLAQPVRGIAAPCH
ncbi:hypothetical protein EV361DRAFT_956967, partial [Lentinula raphanica]